MSYQVIARKYRPQRFCEVVGQEHVTQTLANAIAQNRIAHAYLFCGPRGTGKTTIARIFAKCLNCTGGPKPDFPEDDPRAREIAEGRSLDVIEIDGASNRGIEDIRELRDTVKFAPAASKFKIYIIDEVHMLSKDAFNALLKTLEEPPAHVKFMFATTEPEKVLPTILSRCQRFDLRRIPTALIVNHLRSIAAQEGIQVDEATLLAVARGADGGMRDAESSLDQLISFCGTNIKEPDALSMYGLTAQSKIQQLTAALLRQDSPRLLTELDALARQGKDLHRLLSDLLSHVRNVLVFKASGGRLDLLDISEMEAADLQSLAQSSTPEALSRTLDVLASTESRMRDAGSRRIMIEVGLLKAAQAAHIVPIDQILTQLQALRGQFGSASPSVHAEPVSPPAPAESSPPPAPRRAEPSTSPPLRAATPLNTTVTPTPDSTSSMPEAAGSPPRISDLATLWAQLIEAVGRVSPFTRTYLIEAHPVSFERQVLTIGFDKEFSDHLGLVDNSKNRTLLQTKLAEAGHRDCQVRFVQADRPEGAAVFVPPPPPPPTPQAEKAEISASRSAPAPATPTGPKPAAPPKGVSVEEFKNDPLIKQALEIFKGQIVEVRG